MKVLMGLSTLLVLSGCVTVPLSSQEQAVRLLMKSDPPMTCRELSKVHAPGFGSMTEEGREADLKRAAFKVQGNVVRVDRRDENNTIFGTAFSCPPEALFH